MTDTHSEGVEQHDTINQLVTVGEFGFLTVDGPLSVEKDGTRWTVIIPTGGDNHRTPSALAIRSTSEGANWMAAVLIADCEVVGGGVVELTDEPEGEGALHVVVDQYAMGGP